MHLKKKNTKKMLLKHVVMHSDLAGRISKIICGKIIEIVYATNCDDFAMSAFEKYS